MVGSLHDIAAEKQVKLTLEGGAVEVKGVPDLVHGIFYNLCDNAIKYNRPGGSVTVTVSKENGCPVITVADTGKGMDSDTLTHF